MSGSEQSLIALLQKRGLEPTEVGSVTFGDDAQDDSPSVARQLYLDFLTINFRLVKTNF